MRANETAAALIALVATLVALAGPTRADASAPLPLPVVLVHGLGGSSLDFDVLRVRLEAAGVPADRVHALNFPGAWNASNRRNAELVAHEVERVRKLHGVAQVNVIAHSMGNLAVRHYLDALGGAPAVRTYVSLGGMHRGIGRGSRFGPCEIPAGMVTYFDEICAGGAFLARLNHGDPTPGTTHYVSIYSADDEVVPAASAWLRGADNLEVEGVAHSGRYGLLEDREVFGLLFPYVR